MGLVVQSVCLQLHTSLHMFALPHVCPAPQMSKLQQACNVPLACKPATAGDNILHQLHTNSSLSWCWVWCRSATHQGLMQSAPSGAVELLAPDGGRTDSAEFTQLPDSSVPQGLPAAD